MSLVLALALQATATGCAAPPAGPDEGIVVFCEVAVRADADAIALATADSQGRDFGGFTIAYRKGDRLDADWVKRQLVANGLVGAPVPLDRIAAAVQQISLAYVRNGYVNSGVLIEPEADGGGGQGRVLALRLIAGRLAEDGLEIAWQDGRRDGLTPGYVIARLPSARARPLNGIAIERDFRSLAADDAIATVKADLQPGVRPGEARLSLLLDPAPRFEIDAGVANNRSPAVGGVRLGGGLAIRQLLTPGDRIAFAAGLTAGRPDLQLGYSTPLVVPGLRLDLRGGSNRAAVVDAPLRNLAIRARDQFVEGGVAATLWQRPLAPATEGGAETSAQQLVLSLGLIHRETRTFLLGQPFSFSPGSVRGVARYSAVRVGAEWTRRSSGTVWIGELRFTQGFEGTRSDVTGIAAPSPRFSVLTGQISHARRLGRSGWEVRARLAGQYGVGALYPGERFVAGGSQSVRGYRESLLLADRGVFGSLELARPLLLGSGGTGLWGLRWGSFTPSLFADGALVRNADTGFQPDVGEIASIGAGLAWTPSPVLTARISYGHALVDAPVTGSRDVQDDGLSFSLGWNLRF